MKESESLELIEEQIIQIESYLWEQNFETPFRLKRLLENKWELISWKKISTKYRLTYTLIPSFELSGGIPDVELSLAEANNETKLKIGPYLESFMKRYHEISEKNKKQKEGFELFNSYLQTLRQKIDESESQIRRNANSF